MSGPLAIAAVTAVLRDVLTKALNEAGAGAATVSADAPDRVPADDRTTSRLNLFLHRVTPVAALANAGLPSMDAAGRGRLANPPLAVDLHYFVTAYGAGGFDAEVLLGCALQAFHEHPVLGREQIRDVLTAGAPALPDLVRTSGGAGLADQAEQVRITPEPADDVAAVWQVIRSAYRPTLACRAGPVLIERTLPLRPVVPVRDPRVSVVGGPAPVIDEVRPAAGPGAAATPGSEIVLRGRRLAGEPLEVRIGEVAATDPEPVADGLRCTLPAGVRAGIVPVQVVRDALRSNVARLPVAPAFRGLDLDPAPAGTGPYGGTAAVAVEPPVGRGQRVELRLDGASVAYVLPASPREADDAPVLIPLDGIERGTYLVRVVVEGVPSPLDPAPGGHGPTVSV